MAKTHRIAFAILATIVIITDASAQISYSRGCFHRDECNKVDRDCAAKCVEPEEAQKNCSGQTGCKVIDCGSKKACVSIGSVIKDIRAFQCKITDEKGLTSLYLFLRTISKGNNRWGFVALSTDVTSTGFKYMEWMTCVKHDVFTKNALKRYANISTDCAVELNLQTEYGPCSGTLTNAQFDKLATCFKESLPEIGDALYNKREKCALENWNISDISTPRVSSSPTPTEGFIATEPTPEESTYPTPTTTSSISLSPTPSNLPLCASVAGTTSSICSFDKDLCTAQDGTKKSLICTSITNFGTSESGSFCKCTISSTD